MGWRRDEIWFDADVGWLHEVSGGHGAAALPAPAPLRFTTDTVEVDIPNGLAESRRRRAELRRRRHARRARAAALVVAPATLVPIAGQKLGVGSAAGGPLADDPPSLVRDPTIAGAASASLANRDRAADAETQRPRIHWRRATSHGLWYAGSLSGGTQLPLEGPDWVTWNPVEDRVSNEPRRLYGHERTIRTILSVVATYREANPDAPRVVVGDLSFQGGGPMELHRSHQNGLDVDVYYPRLDGALRAPRSGDQVDRRLAQDLLDRFVAAGAVKVFVGYSTGLRGPSAVVVPYANHGDHMHVRFPAPRG
jgi:murein endopeptidase